jgi:DNA repair protein RadC
MNDCRSNEGEIKKEKVINDIHRSILKERIEEYGHVSLVDEEVISLLTGIPVKKLKKNIIRYGLVELIKFSSSMDITKPQKRKLELLFEISKRLSTANFKEKIPLDSSGKAGEFFIQELKYLTQEVFIIAVLDTQNRLISLEKVFEGTINETAVYPRTIVKIALEKNASSIIMGHNHPGGSLKPSSADIESTKRIVTALDSVNIKTFDHIIVGENSFFSFAESGLL